MNTDLILSSISRHITFTEEESKYYLSILKPRRIKKRQYLLQEGDINRYTTFVVNGCLRSFVVDKNGTEHVFQFAVEGWWMADLASLNTQTPSMMNVDALEDTDILMISKEDMDEFYIKVPKYEHFSRIILENAFVAHQTRIMQNICYTAAERYQYFCEKYPNLIQRIPQIQIASYLGITPEFLSKLRKQLLLKK